VQSSTTPLSPTGFWSYTSSDDTSSRGRLSQLRRLLADELQLRLGRAQMVHIFQDVAAIPHGTDWRKEIHKALVASSFLIPIITPAFLQSEMCCEEVARFREHEKEAGRDDLIFPFHYVNVDDLLRNEAHDAAVLDLLRSRQWIDFRSLRLKDPNEEEVSLELAALAHSIRAALRRSTPQAAATSAATPFPATSVPRSRPAAVAIVELSPPTAVVSAPQQARTDTTEPEMVELRPGRFVMGVPDQEEAREQLPMRDRGVARPQHAVTFRQGFYLAKYPVTRGEFARFMNESGYRIPKGGFDTWVVGNGWQHSEDHDWRDPGFPQTDQHPVVGVDEDDAMAYARWLSDKTGRHYRLPSEAEWEYAARAGTTTARFWGDGPDGARRHANASDLSLARELKAPSDPWRFFDWDDGYPFTSPVGSFAPNSLGLYDMLGNVQELTQDLVHSNYNGAPDDGSAWTTADSTNDARIFVARGGGWSTDPQNLRSGHRSCSYRGIREAYTGFRLVRTL